MKKRRKSMFRVLNVCSMNVDLQFKRCDNKRKVLLCDVWIGPSSWRSERSKEETPASVFNYGAWEWTAHLELCLLCFCLFMCWHCFLPQTFSVLMKQCPVFYEKHFLISVKGGRPLPPLGRLLPHSALLCADLWPRTGQLRDSHQKKRGECEKTCRRIQRGSLEKKQNKFGQNLKWKMF